MLIAVLIIFFVTMRSGGSPAIGINNLTIGSYSAYAKQIHEGQNRYYRFYKASGVGSIC